MALFITKDSFDLLDAYERTNISWVLSQQNVDEAVWHVRNLMRFIDQNKTALDHERQEYSDFEFNESTLTVIATYKNALAELVAISEKLIKAQVTMKRENDRQSGMSMDLARARQVCVRNGYFAVHQESYDKLIESHHTLKALLPELKRRGIAV